MASIGGRYSRGKNVLSALVSRQPNFSEGKPYPACGEGHSIKVDVYHKVSDRLSLGTELEYSYPTEESSLRLASEYMFRNSRVQASVDSGGKLSVLAQDASGVGVSGVADYWRDEYRLGLSLQVSPPS
eukprot:GHVO01034702.1.p2 GENE.GHVO01034702.1~~GHVO01034702.1.p2  ORF type:complete len:128 (-),score=0.88 GHVO01034702.1:50-433(-)